MALVGPIPFFLLSVREIMRTLVYWHAWNVYETDVVSQPLPDSYAKE